MSFSDTINNNCESHCSVSWWPKFAFHYTDVTNAANILSEGFLYSRAIATQQKIMQNDNASRQVIDMTNPEIASMVRFYFRPLTPTQYYNEGYKHPSLRYDGDENANTPVPIFFLFDLEKVLMQDKVYFSEKSQAGHGSTLLSGADEFSRLNFDAIYSQGFENFEEYKPYRHAEIVHSGSFPIDPCLNTILCRNNVERLTLLNLLKEKNKLAYAKYCDKIKVYNHDVFDNNGLYVSECLYHQNTISISFSDTLSKRKYTGKMKQNLGVDGLKPIKVKIELCWFNSRSIISRSELEATLNYEIPHSLLVTRLPYPPQSKNIGIKVFFEERLMCYTIQSLEQLEMLK